MEIWPILLCLILFNFILDSKYLPDNSFEVKINFAWILLFFMNYAPLALFDAYNYKISAYLDFWGLSFMNNVNFIYFSRYLWNWILIFLQYSNILCWLSFWVSALMSLYIQNDRYPYNQMYRCLLWGFANTLFFLLYSVSAGDSEYWILYSIMVGVFFIVWDKHKNYYRFNYEFSNTIEKYICLILISTALSLKRIFYNELEVIDIICFCFSYFSYAALIYFLTFYFSASYKALYDYFEKTWQELQEKREKSDRIEESLWKICMIYILVALIAYAIYLTYSLIASLWGEAIILKELFFVIISGAAGNILICSEDGNYNLREGILNSFSLYFEVFIVRRVIIL